MNREQFIKEARKTAKTNGVDFRIDKKRGKGSHITIYYGDKFATVPNGELKRGTLAAIRKQLNID
ncbi:MAG: type II toxin-antitoxin system HicA family toxin [Thiotrichales bacterium]|nr:type II toxin-antitoxin system HicA family toxin [Thiotrichales bacterium]